MPQGFRFEPTTVHPDRLVDRSRLVRALHARFEHRVTTVTASAGFGKSTLLAMATSNNLLDPVGRDVWLTVASAGTTGAQLVAGVATALGLDPGATEDDTLELLADALWSAAPDDVVVIIDDAHLLDGEGAVAAMTRLIELLPANGHVVISSRHRLGVPLARLRAQQELLELDERDLALDDAELHALTARDGDGPDTLARLPRHVATADLQLAAGINASADFLWEEVLSGLDDDRLGHLRRCSVVDSLDDELVHAISDGAHDTASLLGGLPLVEHTGTERRMHAILREALASRLQPGEERKALSIAATAEAERGNLPAAVVLHHAAGDPISALDTARDFAIAPTVVQTMDDVATTRRIVEEIESAAPVAMFLDALAHFAGVEELIARRFIDAADAAHAAGDLGMETMALYRAGQTQLVHHNTEFWATVDRIRALGEQLELASAVDAYFSSIIHQIEGRPNEAVEALDGLAPLGRAVELNARSERLYDLGRPEQVAVGLTGEDLANLRPGAAAFIGLSMWARGESTPEASLPVVTRSVERAMRARYTQALVINLGTGVQIALAAGAVDLARRWSDRAREHVADGVGPEVADIEVIARASLTAVVDGDQAGIELLQSISPTHDYDGAAHRNWPSRAQLGSLPFVYLARPDLRALFDGCDFGPAIRSVVAAGRALAAIRDDANPAPAAALAWGRPGLLRAHVLPHHLAELACAAIAAGNDTAREALDQLPGLDDALARAAASEIPEVRATATEILGAAPKTEPFALHAGVLGGTTLERDGVVVAAPEFVKRHKVRELFAFLLENGRSQRHEICAALWPEHADEERALASLRTTLSTLNGVLQPGRQRGRSAFHLLIDGDTVELDSRVTCDADEFERLVADAQADDDAGLPARALASYRRAGELYRGDYLHGIDAPWLVLTRLRLRALAVSTMCRVAELEAARGQPEEAARWAARARSLDPLNERAGRVFIASLDATGDRSAARSAARELTATLTAADLRPSPATARLVERMG